ncbi:SDR family NAD(P)-dependent oxidoreductase [Paraburkholderia sp. C35]|uniref:SDR family NAD(P)-dependent oxidoreductase n=1 Tax=Paraburkholderia sp. C35 TaxID=2126993 RepID=UPI000D695A52|nr:SDR family NAD(P)-dependent oxidoreductase [Paraburkholderia sp. C35]
MRLADKVAIVTGTGQGIGRAILRRFVQEGARVVAVEWSREAGEAALDGLPSERVHLLCADAHAQSTVDEAVQQALTRFGGLHVLVNNAVRYTERKVTECSDEDWITTIDSALSTGFRFCRAAIPHMIRHGGGSIVNLASINHMVANPGLAAYTAAKGGVAALSKQIAIEYGTQGIRCNAVSPALIATERTMQGVSDHDMRLNRECYPVGRIGEPDDVANAVLFLASDEASFITGVDLAVDGGLTSLAASAVLSTRIRGWWGRPPITLPDA